MADILSFITVLALFLAFWLLPKYLERRVGEAARGAVDKSVGTALAEHRHSLDKQLEDHRALLAAQSESVRQALAIQRERYARDYGLFAERRNAVFAEVFGLYEQARGNFARHFASLIVSQDLGSASYADLCALTGELEQITAGERASLQSALTQGDLEPARKIATKLVDRDGLRRANVSFQLFKNASVLHALYFTPALDATLKRAIDILAKLSIFADEAISGEHPRGSNRRHCSDLVRELDSISSQLRSEMRAEMQGGFAQASGSV